MEQFFFTGWINLLRVLVIGVLAYVTLVFFLRISGKRTLSKMNAFDLVVTVALGSTLATVLLNRNVTLAQGALAFALLVGMQYAVTWSSVRIPPLRRFVTGEPTLLLYRGEYLPAALRRTRVTAEEIRASVRAAGLSGLGQVEAVVLETDGTFSVVREGAGSGASSLAGVRNLERREDIPQQGD